MVSFITLGEGDGVVLRADIHNPFLLTQSSTIQAHQVTLIECHSDSCL